MSKARRKEDKRKRREKRQAKRATRSAWIFKPIRALVDATLSVPGAVKFDLGEFAMHEMPGKQKYARFERNLRRGPIGSVPEVEHWAMEEFLWHGAPGDDWKPIEAYLAHKKNFFTPESERKLRLWSQARLGIFEVGPVSEGTVQVRDWDPQSQQPVGEFVPAISLSLDRAKDYEQSNGKVTLAYLAPWEPEQGLHCLMGYGVTDSRDDILYWLPLLGLADPRWAAEPLPWKLSRSAENDYFDEWSQRDWCQWFQERLTFPFHAVIPIEPRRLGVVKIVDLLPAPFAKQRDFGVYFKLEWDGEVRLIGATAVNPVAAGGVSFLSFTEYRAYRAIAGPPPLAHTIQK